MRMTGQGGLKDDTYCDILLRCLSLEKRACRIYTDLSSSCTEPGLRPFWKGMAQDERAHIRYWKRLLDIARKGAIPDVIDDPYEVIKNLELMEAKIEALAAQGTDPAAAGDALHLASRLEFSMLNPAFLALFQFFSVLGKDGSIEEQYDAHLERLTSELQRYSHGHSGLDLIGETIRHIWKNNRRLFVESMTDSLTGVLNRRGFFTVVKPLSYLAHRGSDSVGVMMLDIDDFKTVNDTRGHHAGDTVLRAVARGVQSAVRASDVVGRYGGDEFIVFFPQISPDALVTIAEKISSTVGRKNRSRIPITLSIGLAQGTITTSIDAEINALVHRADLALFRAKRRGKAKIIVSREKTRPLHHKGGTQTERYRARRTP